MDTKWLSYEELGQALGITPASAERLAIRRKWAKKPGHDGRIHVAVPEAFSPLTHQAQQTPAQPRPWWRRLLG
jgi:hypothetical protein